MLRDAAHVSAVDRLAQLNDEDARILEFEQAFPRHTVHKEARIRRQFGYSSARYYQILGNLIESPAALVAYPMLINRLRRVRDERRDRRNRPVADCPTSERPL